MSELAALVDREAIRGVVARYARAVDDRDLDALVGCFTHDATYDLEGGETTAVGPAAIRALFVEALARPLMGAPGRSTHLMGPTEIELDGDHARGRTAGVAFLASEVRPTVVVRGLVYRDELRREPDGWRVVHRVHRSTWQAEAPGHLT